MSPTSTAPIHTSFQPRQSIASGTISGPFEQPELSPVTESLPPDIHQPTGQVMYTVAAAEPRKTRSSISKGKQQAFGQDLSQFDLVANNIENALHGMR